MGIYDLRFTIYDFQNSERGSVSRSNVDTHEVHGFHADIIFSAFSRNSDPTGEGGEIN
jgi:hypothetical protein